MKKIALNYIYLSKEHAGGKDQVGINLLKDFTKMVIPGICFLSVMTIHWNW